MADRDTGRMPQGNGVIDAAIVVAALIFTWGSPNKEPRFQIAGSGNGVVRLDTDSGEMLACDMQGCRRIELPMRAKTWGPFKVVVNNVENNVGNNLENKKQQKQQEQQKQLPPPRQP